MADCERCHGGHGDVVTVADLEQHVLCIDCATIEMYKAEYKYWVVHDPASVAKVIGLYRRRFHPSEVIAEISLQPRTSSHVNDAPDSHAWPWCEWPWPWEMTAHTGIGVVMDSFNKKVYLLGPKQGKVLVLFFNIVGYFERWGWKWLSYS